MENNVSKERKNRINFYPNSAWILSVILYSDMIKHWDTKMYLLRIQTSLKRTFWEHIVKLFIWEFRTRKSNWNSRFGNIDLFTYFNLKRGKKHDTWQFVLSHINTSEHLKLHLTYSNLHDQGRTLLTHWTHQRFQVGHHVP